MQGHHSFKSARRQAQRGHTRLAVTASLKVKKTSRRKRAGRLRSRPAVSDRRGIHSLRLFMMAARGLSPAGETGGRRRGPFEFYLQGDVCPPRSSNSCVARTTPAPLSLWLWLPDQDGETSLRTYTPDIVEVTRNGEHFVLELRARFLAREAPLTARGPAPQEMCETTSTRRFVVLADDEIRADPWLANWRLIMRQLGPRDEEAAEALRQIIGDAHSKVMLGQLSLLAEELGVDRRRSFSALMRFAADRTITLDLSEPISPSTCVTLGGR
jgi:hypothetical protein